MDSLTLVLTSSLMLCFSVVSTTSLLDTIAPGQSIRDGETIISTGRSFELGFFSPGTSSTRYLGIWYKKYAAGTVVWVANRETPILDRSGVLNFTRQGVLLLLRDGGKSDVVWSSANLTKPPKNPTAQLLDSGNFVVRDGNSKISNDGDYLWQSFDYPTDTTLPGMKLGRNLVTGRDWTITSWKSPNNPARGEFSLGIDPRGYPQLVLKQGNTTIYRGGSWNGVRWTGSPRQQPNPVYDYRFVFDDKEVAFSFDLLNDSLLSRMVVNPTGATGRFNWKDDKHGWVIYYLMGADQCDIFAKCGPSAKCDMDGTNYCNCLDGFKPGSPGDWSTRDWSGGCTTTAPLGYCKKGEGFVRVQRVKLPDTSGSWFDRNMSLRDCKQKCLKNCSCTAYTSLDITRGGSGCLLWFGGLVDLRSFPDTGQDLYVKVAASYLGFMKKKKRKAGGMRIAMLICSIAVVVTAIVLGWRLCVRKMKQRYQGKKRAKNYDNDDLELPIFDFTMIRNATDGFSDDYKLGEGGFGPVYRGTLCDGQVIAVKRLSMSSGQGLEEFKNEVVLISKLQHRNLVRLLGCCIEGAERMLIYEYMPNKSLDYFIFDESRSKVLDWQRRIHVIEGIARGLLYLHQDSRLRIIHRDLKVSNVLLDIDLNPKISDFGMARMFGGDQTEASTNRVMGTFGYMAPEYAIDGLFSMKSDIFSFGVLVLEVLSGRKNRGFFTSDHGLNLLGHVWKLWMEEKALELVKEDQRQLVAADSRLVALIKRHIHVGLLCVQQEPDDRPNMSTVVLMLGGDGKLPEPKPPGFFAERKVPETDSSSSYSYYKSRSIGEITVTDYIPR
ncbi:unnamed protein product [Linum trigynum]|uniref:Receptor-like serine/threonine-protein kinase n=1 Tax=Linum trigynum TaxID=586398 RepID=A0AAV2C897_9ROSI